MTTYAVVLAFVIPLLCGGTTQAMVLGVNAAKEWMVGERMSGKEVVHNLMQPQCQHELRDEREYKKTGLGRNYSNWWEAPKYDHPEGKKETSIERLRRASHSWSDCRRAFWWYQHYCWGNATFVRTDPNFGRPERCKVPLEQQPFWTIGR